MTEKTVQYVAKRKDPETGEVIVVKSDLHPPMTVSETVTLDEIKAHVPHFFNVKLSADEKYQLYRGCVIVTGIDNHASPPVPRIAAFLYDNATSDVHYLTAGCELHTIQETKRFIDRVLEEGQYYYGMQVSPEDDLILN